MRRPVSNRWPVGPDPRPRVMLVIGLACLVLGPAITGIAAPGPAVDGLHTNLMVFRTPAGDWKPVKTVADWQSRRREIVAAATNIMGSFPGSDRRGPVAWRVVGKERFEGFERWQIEYESDPGAVVPAFLLVPAAALQAGNNDRFPAVLGLHQTHPQGRRVVVGLGNSPDDEYGVELVRRGFVVLAPPYTRLADYQPDIAARGFDSGTMLAVWNNVRGLDLLASLPWVRTNGFAAIGHSLGGHNAVFTAVFDDRIRVIVSSCGLDSFRDYYDGDPANWAPQRGWCQDRYMPRLAAYRGRLAELPFDFPELIGALAPRAVFLNAPKGDTNFRWRSVDRVVAAARPVFALYGADTSLRVEHPEGPHRFPPELREAAYRWIETHLGPPPAIAR